MSELFYIPASRFKAFVGYLLIMGYDFTVSTEKLHEYWNEFLSIENQAKS